MQNKKLLIVVMLAVILVIGLTACTDDVITETKRTYNENGELIKEELVQKNPNLTVYLKDEINNQWVKLENVKKYSCSGGLIKLFLFNGKYIITGISNVVVVEV